MRYDYVIVGAGSAGCVLAARLSEDPACSVLLLEAGPDDDAGRYDGLTRANFLHALAETDRLWADLPARRTPAQAGKQYLRGFGIGGSSAVNAMVALAGHPDDYDAWVAAGATGWSWSDVRPVFAGLDRILPLSTMPQRHWGAVDHAVAAARDGNVEAARLTMHNGRRASAAGVYLAPARARANLHVRAGVAVSRLLLDGSRVSAVEIRVGDAAEVVEAGEVIVSAGALHSPGVLARSGIVRGGLGDNLRDHASLRITLDLKEDKRTHDIESPVIMSLARFSSGDVEDDLQLLPMNATGIDENGRRYGVIMVSLMHVHSTGHVRPSGPDPYAPPVIDFAMLTDERDLRRLRTGFLALLALAGDAAVRDIADGVYLDDKGTRFDALAGATDDDLDAWIVANVGDYVHACGTCRMGSPDDPLAVVDAHGRVIGYDGVRVCDASIFPDLPRANTHFPTVMAAERIAASIRAGG